MTSPQPELPAEFDPGFYKSRHPDLRRFSDAQLSAHYAEFGRAEGRAASRASGRPAFLSFIPGDVPALEIGPFDSPVLTGPQVRYFDVLDRDGLVERARAHGMGGDRVPAIHYVSPTADLGVVDKAFPVVVSSHCVEHQPDLVRHLAEVERLLLPGGRYFLLVPDKRFCFDHFLPETTIADVLAAHREARRLHTATSVVEHLALTCHNDCGRHWTGDHGTWQNAETPARVRAALAHYEATIGQYVDVHAWKFTPGGFRQILSCLVDLGLSGLRVERVYDTVHFSHEFAAVLTKPG